VDGWRESAGERVERVIQRKGGSEGRRGEGNEGWRKGGKDG
jgi:hypothetical protein